MSSQNDFSDEQPKKQGMSSTAKVVVILGSIAAVGLLACCGGGAFIYDKIKNSSMNPGEIRKRTQEIVQIEILEGFEPVQSMHVNLADVRLRWVIYQRPGDANSMLMIMEMNQPLQPGNQGTPKQNRDQMIRAMREQQAQQQGNMGLAINEESSETREFTISGKKVEFDFIKGTAADKVTRTRQVVGLIPGRQGNIMLTLMIPENAYDEDAITEMIESMRLPGEDFDNATEQPDGAAEAESAEKSEETRPSGEVEVDPEAAPESSP